ncbi:Gfo/Idh/MocA family protein [Winogradskyella sp.]|uniref:Gfo/Idh/MocA family protein n=1 Tax=Winogradskyella sp. TaxID=1883156 RepID=UPI003F6DA4B8
MKPKVINWGIIGAGKIASEFAKDILEVPNSKLSAIASRNPDKAERFAIKYNFKKAYGSYNELVLDDNLDAIYIATPHAYHKEHTLLCLKNRKPVLCEKPLAMNLEEVDEMIRLAKTKNVLLMEALWTAFLPHFVYVRDLIQNEKFGKIIQLEADFGFQPPYNENSRLFNKSLGGGSLLDIGIYPIFLALSTLGKPNSIKADAKFFETGVDSECLIEFNYENSKALLKSTFKEETKTEAIFKCEHGDIIINGRFHQPTSVTLINTLGERTLKQFDYTTIGYNYEIEHFNNLLINGITESNIMSFEFSRTLITTLDSIRTKINLTY